MKIRKAVFAGSWYPQSASACKEEIDHYLSQDIGKELARQHWLGGIVPHAGWFYSGHVAAAVMNLLKEEQSPDVVIIFGMHLHPHSSNYLMPEGVWQTPLGDLPVAEDLAHYLQQRFTFQLETPQRFTPDNTIEVQLPMVKYILDPAEVLGLGVPPTAHAAAIGRAVAQWAGNNNKRVNVIGSTDLTHYGDNYGFSPHGTGPAAVEWVQAHNDRRVIDAMLELAPEQVLAEALKNHNSCCAGGVAAAVAAGRQLGAQHAQASGLRFQL